MTDPDDYGVFAEKIRMLEAWTAKEAHKAGDSWHDTKEGRHGPCAPVFQWTAWNESLPKLQQAYKQAADPKILFKAIELCLNRGLPVPRWCAQEFANSWRKVERYEVRTLDEAFDYSNKGVNLHDARRRMRLADKVAIDAIFRIEDGESSESVLREIASEVNVSYECARKWYYDRRKKFSVL